MFDKLASFTPNLANIKNIPSGVGSIMDNLFGNDIKHNRELEKLNLQHANSFEMNKWNALWNKELEDTKTQRFIKDLEKAGINPILAAGGASAGSGASGSSSGASSGAGGQDPTSVILATSQLLNTFKNSMKSFQTQEFRNKLSYDEVNNIAKAVGKQFKLGKRF